MKRILFTSIIFGGSWACFASYAATAGEVNWGGSSSQNELFNNNYQPFSDDYANEFIGNDPYDNYTGPMYAPGDINGSATCYQESPVGSGNLVVVPCEDGATGCYVPDGGGGYEEDDDCDGVANIYEYSGCQLLWGATGANATYLGCPAGWTPNGQGNGNCNNCTTPLGSGIMVFLLGLGSYGLSIVRRNRKNQKEINNFIV